MQHLSRLAYKIITIVPAYNEAENIGLVVEETLKYQIISELLVVDDGSQDKTAAIAKEKGANILRHSKNMGVGAAIRSGIDYALKNGFDIVTILAGDGQHKSAEIPALVDPILKEKYDFVIGSRYLNASTANNITKFRYITTKVYTFIFNIFVGGKFTDVTNGFRAFCIDIFRDKEINLWQDWLNTYELEPYLFYQLVKRGYRIKEIPTTLIYHKKAKSHIKPILDWWRIIRPLFLLKLKLKK